MTPFKPWPVEGSFDAFIEEQKPKPKPCRGLVFRCERTSYMGTDGSVNFKTRFRPLVRKSCPGCENCGWIEDDLHERLNEYYARWDPASYPIIHDNAKHGALYELRITNVSTDWETGCVDDYDLEFVEYKEDELET